MSISYSFSTCEVGFPHCYKQNQKILAMSEVQFNLFYVHYEEPLYLFEKRLLSLLISFIYLLLKTYSMFQNSKIKGSNYWDF